MIKSLRNLAKKRYSTVTTGEGFTKKTYLLNDQGEKISFWNDIPLKPSADSNEYNICIEIPRHNISKLEVSKSDEFHPIVQDTRKNKFSKEKELRHYAQFPLFNYGFLPQTWENDFTKTPEGFFGDDDPLDVCDLSSEVINVGRVYPAKILGAFCLIDQGEVDWKMLAINSEEARQNNIETLEDFERYQPGRLNAVKHWFEYIKTYDGKKPNFVYYEGQIFDAKKAEEVIAEMNEEWKALRDDKAKFVNESNKEQYKEKSSGYFMN